MSPSDIGNWLRTGVAGLPCQNIGILIVGTTFLLLLVSYTSTVGQFFVRKWNQFTVFKVIRLYRLTEISGVDNDLFYRATSRSVQFDGIIHIHEIQSLK